MKRVLSVLMAGALTVAMAVPAFAASAVDASTIYDADGEKINVSGGDVYGNVEPRGFQGDVKIDGVVPGVTMYVPLGDSMSYGESDVLNAEGVTFYNVTDDGADLVSSVQDATHYLPKDGTAPTDADNLGEAEPIPAKAISLDSLTNDDYFKFDVDKDEGSKYVKKIEVLSNKKLDGLTTRTAFLKIELNESTTYSDLKSDGTITFKAKADSSSYASGSKKLTRNDIWSSGETVTIDYTFWINNVKTGNDSNVDTGDRIFFDPDDNEDNTLVWGDDRAALFFEGNDDAGKFYARLQTKADSEIYSTYGDPVNADLWFFDFVGNPTVPATSRATLTLGIPWDEDDDYTPNPEDCFIYEVDADGTLTDVTSSFTYDEDNDGTTEIPGWTIKTRTLGTYVISDTELDTTIIDDVDEEEVEDDTDTTVDTGKEIPNTGSSDMVGVAVVAAVVSLAAAGAVAFKKASK